MTIDFIYEICTFLRGWNGKQNIKYSRLATAQKNQIFIYLSALYPQWMKMHDTFFVK